MRLLLLSFEPVGDKRRCTLNAADTDAPTRCPRELVGVSSDVSSEFALDVSSGALAELNGVSSDVSSGRPVELVRVSSDVVAE